jgi:hypothetical protein
MHRNALLQNNNGVVAALYVRTSVPSLIIPFYVTVDVIPCWLDSLFIPSFACVKLCLLCPVSGRSCDGGSNSTFDRDWDRQASQPASYAPAHRTT